MRYEDKALVFACDDDGLYGVATVPEQPARRGVLVIVGGPQYRAGSHRQFTLLARALAAQGIAAMRFDYRGMGDSSGDMRSFEDVAPDVRSAIDAFFAGVPELEEVVLWGLCDGASAAALYAGSDARVSGMVLLNPWVRTDEGLARSTLKHYYRERIRSPALWKKIASGRFDVRAAVRSLADILARASRPRPGSGQDQDCSGSGRALPERMHGALSRFGGKVLVVLSSADLTAREFADTAATPGWQALMESSRFTRHELAPADHTFSRREWRDQVAAWTADWLRSW
ncbi:hydrolase 1, exosortase A system-associated [Telluria aromaticivorans]|uniref:Hydrolase 1, exosortase A system-associated n=1 Tax=Telluria aromaticivorans TaxID=2725995 RepID=A0A7Y2P157_9BURK|nr:hydrolase 1, exosortase A system-associated [Telluria aromaticivorans]NNG24221.1 hydrolase 1, exosortase A system-associated [Telluria aromaticivorans]